METTKYFQSTFEAQIDKSTVESTREITFVIASQATGRAHRNKFIYNWDNWKLDSFNSNSIVGYQHNVYGDNMCIAPNPDDVIAKAEAWIDTYKGSKSLISKATFEPPELNQTAEKVFRKIIWGSLKAASTGVLPADGDIKKQFIRNDKDEIIDYTLNFQGQELVEWSIVNIPADANALRRSMKSHTIAALNFVQKSLPELSMNDLEKMSVREILDLFEKRDGGEKIAQLEMELIVGKGDPNLNTINERLSKIKNRKWTL